MLSTIFNTLVLIGRSNLTSSAIWMHVFVVILDVLSDGDGDRLNSPSPSPTATALLRFGL